MSAPAHAPDAHGHGHGRDEGHQGAHGHDAGHGHHEPSFFHKYIFSTDAKMIGRQFLITTMLWMLVGGGLALIVRWQLGFPGEPMPIVGGLLDAWYGGGGTVNGNAYNMAFTMHASVMIFLVIIP